MPDKDNNISFLISPERAREIQTQLGLGPEGILTAFLNGTLDVKATTNKLKPLRSTIKPSYQGEIKDANKERLNRSLSNYAANNFLLSTSNIRPNLYGNYSPGLGLFAGNLNVLTLSMGFDPFNASNYYKAATVFPRLRNWGLSRTLASELNNEVKVAGELGRNLTKTVINPKNSYNISDNITLYRANPTLIKNPMYKGEFYGDNTGQYVGKWFTDDPIKPNWYASNYARHGENPLYFQTTVPRYWAEKLRASNIISNPKIEYEPEDFILSNGVNGLQGQPYSGRVGTLQYLNLRFKPIQTEEPRTSLRFFEQPLSRISEAERTGIPKGERNQPYNPKLISEYVLGDEAVKMFKEYGGESIPEGSINGKQLRQYVNEAREKYGLVGNKNITDEEIAQALYKQVKELGGNTQALNAQGEPLLLFRADTKRYTQLLPRVSPEELALMNGTMDNSLGTLFLGELPFTDGGDAGVMKYLNTGAYAYSKDGKLLAANWRPSQTGGSSIKIGDKVYRNWRDAPSLNTEPSIANIPEGAVLIDGGTPTPSGLVTKKYKLPVSLTEAEAQDINGFVVRTPSTHYMTDEMLVLAQPEAVNPESPAGKLFNWLTKEKPTFFYKDDEFPTIMYKGKEYPALANSPEARELWRDLYRQLLNNAENEGSGLLISESTNGWLRREHPGYTYFALPNFNIKGAKHILPYDLRIPRNWKDFDLRRKRGGKIIERFKNRKK